MTDILEAEFESDEYKVSPNKIWAPKEVCNYFQKYKCLVCGSPVECEDPHVFRSQGCFQSYADCLEDAFHYEISISWKDPKNIILNHEEIMFEFDGRLYKVKKNIINNNERAILNDITITHLDADGSASENKEIAFSMPGKIFNFRKFSPELFANRINVMKVFG